LDVTSAESNENQFVSRLTKYPLGKKLPALDTKLLDQIKNDAVGKVYFNLEEEEEEEQKFLQPGEDEEENEGNQNQLFVLEGSKPKAPRELI
jgi:hypothetical protein